MPEEKALYVQALDAGSANDLRGFNAAILGGRNFESVTPGLGAIARGHGVLSAGALNVSEQTPTPNNTVRVAAGCAAVRGTQSNSQGSYVIANDAVVSLTIDSKHASLSRTDLIVAQVKDNGFAAFTGDIWALEVVTGTPGSGAPAAPEDSLVLATVNVVPGGGSTVITDDDIIDQRPHARATGGITPVANRNDFPDPASEDCIFETSTGLLLLRTNNTWINIAKNLDADWAAFTPTFGGVTIGNGSVYGRFQKIGRFVVGVAGFDLGSGASGGNVTAVITMTLPVPCYNPGTAFRYMGAGRATINGVFYASTSEISPSYSNQLMFNFATAGQGAWTTTIPANWGQQPGGGFISSSLRVFFFYEAA